MYKRCKNIKQPSSELIKRLSIARRPRIKRHTTTATMQQQAGWLDSWLAGKAQIVPSYATCGLAWPNRCHHMTDQAAWRRVQRESVESSASPNAALHSTLAEGKHFGIAIFDLISKWPLPQPHPWTQHSTAHCAPFFQLGQHLPSANGTCCGWAVQG